MDRLRAHLIGAHLFTADSWRLELAQFEHERDHGYGVLQHDHGDLYVELHEDGETSDPAEAVGEDAIYGDGIDGLYADRDRLGDLEWLAEAVVRTAPDEDWAELARLAEFLAEGSE